MKKNEVKKLAAALRKHAEEINDESTLLVVHLDNKNGNVFFTVGGDDVRENLSAFFAAALSTIGTDSEHKDISISIVNGIELFLRDDTKKSRIVAYALMKLISDLYLKGDVESDEDDDEEDSACDGCPDVATCTEAAAIAYRKAHHMPKPKGKKSVKRDIKVD